MLRFLPLALLALTACGGTEPRYLIDSAPTETTAETAQVRMQVATLEMREVSLPAYAEESQILIEGADGALTPLDNALWADEPRRAVTLRLAEAISRGGSATVAAEPWPLETPAQAAVHVQVSDMVARAPGQSGGQFDLKGQFAISSYDHVVRERIRRFDISVPMPDASPAGIARASGQALQNLAIEITQELRR
ncbi:membrane integrity-associated transporter subunit PqiC [Celeribacter sp. HF31]|uniref:PqiC family protein n=1 Tax=Celeribacter sp. HF31 TaxID=2721558 RepID=UPI001431B9D0|nr:PqiC family protein [Celeribacter sp. HF31]NIY80797.1 membrane integrity-associated transporter subunit PqiC [Celeribacter sp. HF31]